MRCPEHETAVLDDTSVSSLGTLALRGVRTTGQVLLLTTSGDRRQPGTRREIEPAATGLSVKQGGQFVTRRAE